MSRTAPPQRIGAPHVVYHQEEHVPERVIRKASTDLDQTQARRPQRYFLLNWDDELDAGVVEIRAESMLAAIELVLLERELSSVSPFPAWDPTDRRPDPYDNDAADSYALCVLETGDRFLAGEANWSEGSDVRVATVIAAFTPDERLAMERCWPKP